MPYFFKKKYKKILFLLFFLPLFIATTIASSIYYYYFNTYSQNNNNVIINKGLGIIEIAALLQKNQVITNELVFIITTKILNLYHHKKFIAGEYKFHALMNMHQVWEKISTGDVTIHKITIPEGYNIKETIDLINQANGIIIQDIELSKFPEGSILPDTYFYTYGMTNLEILQKMQQAMITFLDSITSDYNYLNNKVINSKLDILILASIIEKETCLSHERAKVAQVYINRLQRNMRLQADPTVIYGITLGYSTFNRKLTKRDLLHNSEYNTYIKYGLPPTPICNPGKASIIAALYPELSKHLYFVADGKGGHLFAQNMNQHLKNIVQFKQSDFYKNNK